MKISQPHASEATTFLFLLLFTFLCPIPFGAKALVGQQTGQGTSVTAPPPEAQAILRRIERITLAKHLEDYAEQSGSPESLLTAAGILANVRMAGLETKSLLEDLPPERMPEAVSTGAAPQKRAQGFGFESLLESARTMAGAESALAEEITALQLRSSEGGRPEESPPQELRVAESCVPAGKMEVWNLAYPGEDYALVSIAGDGDTDLDLYVFDSEKLIDASQSATDVESIVWWVRVGGTFRIVVENLGRVANCYVLISS